MGGGAIWKVVTIRSTFAVLGWWTERLRAMLGGWVSRQPNFTTLTETTWFKDVDVVSQLAQRILHWSLGCNVLNTLGLIVALRHSFFSMLVGGGSWKSTPSHKRTILPPTSFPKWNCANGNFFLNIHSKYFDLMDVSSEWGTTIICISCTK